MSKRLFFHPLNRNDDLKESGVGVIGILGVGIGILRKLGVGVGPYTFRLRNPALKVVKFHLLILSTFWDFKYPPACLGGTTLPKSLSQPLKNWGFSFGVSSILILLSYSNRILALFIPACNIALISGGSSPFASLLDRVESKAIRLIGDPSLTLLSRCRKVASLPLFYRYHFGHSSNELTACIPPPMARPHSTQ